LKIASRMESWKSSSSVSRASPPSRKSFPKKNEFAARRHWRTGALFFSLIRATPLAI
jgi:hypothetical protein